MGSFCIEYTKHYYIEGQRIASKIGAGLSPSIIRLDYKVEPITEDPYEAISDQLHKLCELSDECVGFNGEYAYYGKELKCINPLLNLDENEKDSYFYHSDHIGSSSFITDHDGLASQHLQFLPFGELFVEQRSTANYYTPYKFSGKEKDEETSYSYFGARYYMSDVSIWLSVDPLAEKYPNMSPYMYCAGNPVLFVDPDGRSIKIYYAVTDSKGKIIGYRSWVFNGKNQKNAPNNPFVKNFMSAYNHNTKNGGGSKMKEAANSKDYTISLVETDKGSQSEVAFFGKEGEESQEQTVFWNPNGGIKTTEGDILSPASCAEEEFDHSIDQLENSKEHYKNSVVRKDKQYGNKEERRVKQGSTKQTAINNKEVPRNWKGEQNHKGKDVIKKDWRYKND